MKSIFIIIATSFFVTGCVGTQSGNMTVQYPTTGSEVTAVWKEYDSYAQEKNKPKLDFVVTSKKIKKNGKQTVQPVDITDVFSENDKNLYLLTKWRNVLGRSKYEARIYEPGGNLFQVQKTMYKHGTEKWSLWLKLKIKGFPAGELPGTWTARIFMDGRLAYEKQFVLHSKKTVRKVAVPYGKIGVLPFYDFSLSGRKHSWRAARYMAQKLISSTDAEVVVPKILMDNMSKPNVEHDDYLSWIKEDLTSARSSLLMVMEKYNIDALVTGTVFDGKVYNGAKKITIYLVDKKTKSVKEVTVSYYRSKRAFDSSPRALNTHLYKKMFDDFVNNI